MKKQFLIFISLVFVLYLFNKFLMGVLPKMQSDSLINTKQISSQQLFDNTWKIIKKNYYEPDMNGQNWSRWKKHYKGKIKTDEDANVAINTMIESLDDPYSKFLDKENYSQQNESINSKITGIGVNIASDGGQTFVVNVIEDTPAAKAKLMPGDIITKVDGKSITGMKTSQVADLVRGPEDTLVELIILRKKKELKKTIRRKEIKIKTVKSSIIGDIGYIQILSFIGQETSTEFVMALDKTKKTKGLILDLRGNSGGLLPNAVFITNMFVNKGNIVSIIGRNGLKKNIYAQKTNFLVQKPLLVLVDNGSASASEILSGALQDYHRAKLVGTKTFGKGMVQRIIPMPNQTGLNLTIAKYLTPAGHDINKKGIEPDIKVELTENDIKHNRDVQLNKAKLIMAQMINE